jgi:hypothetical protein
MIDTGNAFYNVNPFVLAQMPNPDKPELNIDD